MMFLLVIAVVTVSVITGFTLVKLNIWLENQRWEKARSNYSRNRKGS